MPLSPDIVDSVTIIEAAAPALPGFGIPIIGVSLTANQAIAWDAELGSQLIAQVDQSTWPTVLTSLGFVNGDLLWEELETGFSADEVPPIVLIGRMATPITQVVNFDLGDADDATAGTYTITINDEDFAHSVAQVTLFDLGVAGAAADGDYSITINGELYGPYAASGVTKADVITALTALFPGGQPVTAANPSAESIELTADTAGVAFSFASASPAGTPFSVTNGSAETRADVITALLALFPGLQPVGAAAGGDAEQIDVTSLQAGVGFASAAAAPPGEAWIVTTTTANVGLDTDLVAWDLERTDWYFVTDLSRDPLVNRAMQGPVNSYPRDIVYGSQVSSATDPDATDGNDSTRAASFITTSQRTFVAYVPSATDHDLAAHYFRLLPTDPGAFTWTNVELRPITGDKYTTLETQGLRGLGVDPGRYWYYEELPTRSFGVSRNARMGDGTKFEFVRDRDWVNNEIIVRVSNAIIDEPKIVYDDPGAAKIVGVIRGVGSDSARAGIILPNSFTVVTLTRSEQAPADIAAGLWRGFAWEATLAGSIDSARIRGKLFIV